jgi:hypothetical protein
LLRDTLVLIVTKKTDFKSFRGSPEARSPAGLGSRIRLLTAALAEILPLTPDCM